jgi:hypothetical protein
MKRLFAALQVFFSTSTSWAIIICAGGTAAGFLPWIAVSSSGLAFLAHPTANAFSLARFGDPCWHGIAATCAFAILGLVLIATFTTKPINLWRTLAVFASAVGVIVEICLLLSWAYLPRPTTMDWKIEGKIVSQDPINVYYEPLAGVFVSLGCAAGLLVLSALQTRAILFRGQTLTEQSVERSSPRLN